jgi:hypothetical protein
MFSLEVFIDITLLAALWRWIVSTSNINAHQEYFGRVKAAGA